MKKFLLAIGTIISLTGASAQEANDSINMQFIETKTPRVLVRTADGKFPNATDVNESNSILMKLGSYGYEATGVEITEGGFIFYAPQPVADTPQEEWQMTYMTRPSWAEPTLMRYLNPLSRRTSANDFIAIENGTYDIHYFSRAQDPAIGQQFYELFSIVKSGEPEPDDQPAVIFIVNPDNQSQALTETAAGVYEGEVVLPADGFKICYQSRGYDIPAFAFGPEKATDAAVVANTTYNLTYGYNTYYPFSISTTGTEENLIAADEKVNAKVTFGAGTDTFVVTKSGSSTGITEIGSDIAETYFTLDGRRATTLRKGVIYVSRSGQKIRR